jgi:hypothetical protein
MKKSRKLLIAIPIVLILCIALSSVVIFLGLRYFSRNDRPLVLIQTPDHREQIEVGQGIVLHAIARSRVGVKSLEFWADGEFIARVDAPEEGESSPLVITTGWKPVTSGPHVLLARAVSKRGVEGQATVAVDAVDVLAMDEVPIGSGEIPMPTEEPTVPGDEPSESFEGGEDLEDDPEITSDDVPEGEAAPPEGVPPIPEDDAPGSGSDLLEIADYYFPLFPVPEPEADRVTLRLEILVLETDIVYESVHCYIGFAGATPRWYPDSDNDQSTDESFERLEGNTWNVAEYFSGDSEHLLYWSTDRNINIDITCIGMSDGGAEAIDLGHLELITRPETWDGLTRRAVSPGDEGSFTLDYRISRTESSGSGHPIFLDPSMTVPTNLWLDVRRYSIHWDYEPREEEEPAHGFRIYLNGNLQWIEYADARESGLPPEWFTPPCGEEYVFNVTAFHYGYPDGPESAFSEPVIAYTGDPGERGCEQEVIVRFDTLFTYDLPGDGRYDPGDVGPVYGTFYVNDQVVSFDGRCHGSGICGEFALNRDSEYDINGLTTFYGDQVAQFVVELTPEEDLVVGFDIMDADSGRNNADDAVCGDWRYLWYEDLDRRQETSIESFDRRCKVTLSVEPIFGSPVVEPGELPPLPMLMVQNLSVNEETGQLRIHVRNAGAGTWPAHDLEVAVTWPDGSGIGAYTFDDFFLPPGEETILQHPDLAPGPHPPLGACVLLDPGNAVPEEDDRSPGWTRGRYCRVLPDLTITNVNFDDDTDQLRVTVENIGDGSLENRTLNLEIRLPDGRTIPSIGDWYDVSMEPRDVKVLLWPNVNEEMRSLLVSEGYTMVIDPYNEIAEESGFNNEYVVAGTEQIQIMWVNGWFPYYGGGRNTAQMYFDAYIISGGRTRNIASWTSPEVESTRDTVGDGNGWYDTPEYDYQLWYFDIAGDELLKINISAAVDIVGQGTKLLGRGEMVFDSSDYWGSRAYCYQACNIGSAYEEGGVHYTWIQPVEAGLDYPYHLYPWTSTYTICRLRD